MTDIRVITVGLSSYVHAPELEVSGAADSHRRVGNLFARHTAVPHDWTGEATVGSIRQKWHRWSAESAGSSVIYWAGHGEYANDCYYAALADSSFPLNALNAVTDSEFSNALLYQHERRIVDGQTGWVLLILDTCGSGAGGWRVWQSFRDNPPSDVGILAAAAEGAAFVGKLAEDLERVLDGFNGNDTAGIAMRELMRRLEDRLDLDRQPKRVFHAYGPSALLPHRPETPPAVMAPLDVYAELRRVLDEAPAAVRNHFYEKARGGEIGEATWHFTGRVTERRRICDWLRDSRGGMFVVTGVPGAGKSALLGMILASSDDKIVDALLTAGYAPIPAELRPAGVHFDAVVHLSGRGISEATSMLADRLGLPADRDEFLAQLPTIGSRTLLIDALDESRDPFPIAALLRQMAAHPGVRILVGTRRSLYETPDSPAPADRAVLTALDPHPGNLLTLQRDPVAVADYITTRLEQVAAEPRPGRFAQLAQIISRYDQPFLFARLAVYEIGAVPALIDDDRALTAALADGHTGLFRHAVRRLAEARPKIVVILRALAYARGNGLPRTGGVWATAASALAEIPVVDADIEAALTDASPYIMQDTEFGHAVYRFAHRSFTELFRTHDAEDSAAQARIASTFFQSLPSRPRRDFEAHGYLRNYLPEHVNETDLWSMLAADLGRFDQLDPTRVAMEAFRSRLGTQLPDLILVTMVAHNDLGANGADSGFIRANIAEHLGITAPELRDPRIPWSHLRPITPHVIRQGFGDTSVGIVVAPGGYTILATGGLLGEINLSDPVTGRALGAPLIGHPRSMKVIATTTSADGSVLLASGGGAINDCAIRLWDPIAGRALGEPLSGHSDGIRSMAFATLPDGRMLLASSSLDGTVRLWDPIARRSLGEPLIRHSDVVEAVAMVVSPDGGVVLAAGIGSSIQLWDAITRRSLDKFLTGHTGYVTSMAAIELPDKRVILASGSADTTVRLWDPVTGVAVGRPLAGHTGEVAAVAMTSTSDGQVILASGSDDRTIRLWDPIAGTPLGQPLTGHADRVVSIVFASMPDHRTILFSSSWDGPVRSWYLPSHDVQEATEPRIDTIESVTSVAVAELPSGSAILTTSTADRTLRQWNPLTGVPLRQPLPVGPAANIAMASSPTGREILAVYNGAGTVCFWDLRAGRLCGGPFDYIRAEQMATAFLPGGRLIMVTSAPHGKAEIWWPAVSRMSRLFRRTRIRTMRVGHAEEVSSVAIGVWPDGHAMVASTDGKTVLILDLREPDPYKLAPGETYGVTSMAMLVRPDGAAILATGTDMGAVKLWDPVTGGRLGRYTVNTLEVTSLAMAFVNGCAILAAGGSNGRIQLWNLDIPHDDEPIASFDIRPSEILSLAIRWPYIYAGCHDGLVCLMIPEIENRAGL